MRPLERHGPALTEYEGVADLTFPQGSEIAHKGYFQAKQLTTGGIAVAFVPIVLDSGGATNIATTLSSEPSFRGRDLNGWEITTHGQTSRVTILGPLDAPKNAVHPAQVFRSQRMKAISERASDRGYSRTRFRVSNLLWHPRLEVPEPIKLKTSNFAVTISASEEYLGTAEIIIAERGIAPTAEVVIETRDDSKLSLESHADFMNDLISAFRLATGNKVDWYYGEAFEACTEAAVERFHKDAVTGPFSKTIRFGRFQPGTISMTPKLNFEALAESFLGNDEQVLDRNDLKELIDYFVNACDETSYLEARGLLASTLLELIVLKYSRTKRAHVIMEEKEFKKQAFPVLAEAIKRVDLPKSSTELVARAIDELQGAFRQSFRKRLKFLTEGLNLPLDNETCSKAVKIRNELVHEGTYLPGIDVYSQYTFMIWVDLVALCRLTGYKGDLPLFVEGRRLET